MHILTLQHVDFEGPGSIARFAAARGHTLQRIRVHAGEPLPLVSDFDLLAVMGGPMSVHDEGTLPWLGAEKRFLRQAAGAGKRILGVCLGAQLLAEVLGGAVSRNPEREIGWFPVELTPAGRACPLFEGFPAAFPAFHWHGETFAPPPGSESLAASAACANQAFAVDGRIVALQFHLETTAESMELLIGHCADELQPGPFVQDPGAMRAGLSNLDPLSGLLDRLLSNLTRGL